MLATEHDEMVEGPRSHPLNACAMAEMSSPEVPLSFPREHVTAALVALQAATAHDDPRLADASRIVAGASALLFRADHFEITDEQIVMAVIAAALQLRRARAQVRGMSLPSALEERLVEALSRAIASLGEVGAGGTNDLSAPEAHSTTVGDGRKGRGGLVLVADDEELTTQEGLVVSPPPSASERRDAERIVLEVELGIASDSNFYAGLTMDISTGGVFFATYQLLPVGALVGLVFDLPGGHCVKVNGEVRWLRQSRTNDMMPGMGIAFNALRRQDQEAIEAFCKSRAPLYYDVE